METNYRNEYRSNKSLIMIILLALVLIYSVYLYLSAETLAWLAEENAFFELGTAACFFIGSFLLLGRFLKTRNLFYIMLSLVLFIGGGEEMSWGQHLLGFATPESIHQANVQREFNFHNLEVFNTGNFDGTKKEGWKRLLEINFLFRVFCLFYGIVVPLCVNHMNWFRNLAAKLRLPVPPVSIGIFFLLNWIIYYFVLRALPAGHVQNYYVACSEGFEFGSSIVLLMVTWYFYKKGGIPEKSDS